MLKKYYRGIASCFIAYTILIAPISTFGATLSKGSQGEEVVAVQNSLKKMGYFNYSTATGFYGDITVSAVKRFQEKNKLPANGIVDQGTYDLIQKTAPEKKMVFKQGALDWFKEAQYILKRGTNATVTDVETGKEFQIKRTFGTNHADVEPLTKADAEMIKTIWGGWSWDRRAVVVTVGDTAMAGSMTAMPHAGVDNKPAVAVVENRSAGYGKGQNLDSVKNNGVDGHMDIHFLNSKTHDTNTVQKVHQEMVQVAAKYIEENYK